MKSIYSIILISIVGVLLSACTPKEGPTIDADAWSESVQNIADYYPEEEEKLRKKSIGTAFLMIYQYEMIKFGDGELTQDIEEIEEAKNITFDKMDGCDYNGCMRMGLAAYEKIKEINPFILSFIPVYLEEKDDFIFAVEK